MKILIAGDYCPQDRVAKLIEEDRSDIVFSSVKPFVKESDYSLVNFECAVVESPDDSKIDKFGPCLSCTPKGIDVLKQIGFSCVALANNHFRDYGNNGVSNTISSLNRIGIDYVGGGVNLKDAQKVLYKDIDGNNVAFVNFCENEFSIATKQRGGSAPMNCVDNYHQIAEARTKADYVIVIVHGGHEGWQYPSPRMRKLYRWYIELGADVVVNIHQHCYSGYEIINGKPIFYGLGNFCFDEYGSRDGLWNYGYMVSLNFEDDGISFDLHPYVQCNVNPDVSLLEGKELRYFQDEIKRINEVIQDDDKFYSNYKLFCEKKSGYEATVSPYLNDHIRAAASRGWIPTLLPHRKIKNILNFIECESHRDLLIASLKNKLKND